MVARFIYKTFMKRNYLYVPFVFAGAYAFEQVRFCPPQSLSVLPSHLAHCRSRAAGTCPGSACRRAVDESSTVSPPMCCAGGLTAVAGLVSGA